MDILLARGNETAALLVALAEEEKIEITIPEYVMLEFQGTARRHIRKETNQLDAIRHSLNGWKRSARLSEYTEKIKESLDDISGVLSHIESQIPHVISRLREVANIAPHTQELHFRGDLRFLRGDPPDRPRDGIKDCRIYEAVLAIANLEIGNSRDKFFVTKDSDFDFPELVDELSQLGFKINSNVAQLYYALK